MSSPLAIVLLPGLDGTGSLFGPLLSELGSAFAARVVTYPRARPLGYEELESVVASAIPDAGSYLVVGESFSGPLALRHAGRHPERLLGVVLAASFIRCPRPIPRWSARLVTPYSFRLAPSRTAIRTFLTGRDAPSTLVTAVATAVKSVAGNVLALRAKEIIRCDETATLAAVEVPILYLAGNRDRLVPDRVATDMRRINNDLEVIALEAPHLVLQRAPGEAAAAIRAFGERVS